MAAAHERHVSVARAGFFTCKGKIIIKTHNELPQSQRRAAVAMVSEEGCVVRNDSAAGDNFYFALDVPLTLGDAQRPGGVRGGQELQEAAGGSGCSLFPGPCSWVCPGACKKEASTAQPTFHCNARERASLHPQAPSTLHGIGSPCLHLGRWVGAAAEFTSQMQSYTPRLPAVPLIF